MSKIKKVANVIKDWITGNGIEGAAGLLVGIGLWIFGFKIWSGVAFGIFIHKNWDLAKSAIKSKI